MTVAWHFQLSQITTSRELKLHIENSLGLHHKLGILYLLLRAGDVNDAIAGAGQCLINCHTCSWFLTNLTYAATGLSNDSSSQLWQKKPVHYIPLRIIQYMKLTLQQLYT